MEKKMKRGSIATERSDVCHLVSAAIKATYNTRSVGGVERCVDVLRQLKSLSLSGKDLQLSKAIIKLNPLRSHRHPKIREETQDLLDSWLKTIYTQGRDNSSKAALAQFRLKLKKPAITKCSQMEKKEETESCVLKNLEAGEMTIKLSNLYKKEDQRSLTRETEKVEKEPKIKIDPKKLNLKRRRVTSHDATMKKKDLEIAGNKKKMCSLTTKTLIPPPRRDASCETKQQTEPVKDSSTNPKYAALKNKKTEIVDLFEAAKKAADVADTKGILNGKPEAFRCVEALSLLMKINITPKPREPERMMERLERLTKHKDRKICHASSALLQLWTQRTKETEHKGSTTKTFSNSCRLH